MTSCSEATEALPIEGTYIHWVDELPASLPGAIRFGPYLQTNPGDALFEWPRVARFRVRGGQRIDIEVAAGATKEQAASLARGAPFGALVHQRGELPLHASTVLRPGENTALLIAGVSGAGKSTTAAAFARRDWKVLNDDLSRLTTSGSQVMVWPGFHALKLWHKSCELLNIDYSPLRPTGESKRKYFWTSGEVEGAHLVSAIIELSSEGESQGGLKQLSGSAAIQMLLRQTYRPKLVRALGLKDAHFARVLQVARTVACFRFEKCHALTPADLSKYLETCVGPGIPPGS